MEEELAKWGNLNYQAEELNKACAELRRMLDYRLSDDEYNPNASYPEDVEERGKIGASILISAASPVFNSGMKDAVTFMVAKRMGNAVCTTIYGAELDMYWALSDR